MAITVSMKSVYSGQTEYEVHDGVASLGRLVVRDGVARWVGHPDDAVHWSVLTAVYRHRLNDYVAAKSKFGETALAGWGIHPPTMPRCARRARREAR